MRPSEVSDDALYPRISPFIVSNFITYRLIFSDTPDLGTYFSIPEVVHKGKRTRARGASAVAGPGASTFAGADANSGSGSGSGSNDRGLNISGRENEPLVMHEEKAHSKAATPAAVSAADGGNSRLVLHQQDWEEQQLENFEQDPQMFYIDEDHLRCRSYNSRPIPAAAASASEMTVKQIRPPLAAAKSAAVAVAGGGAGGGSGTGSGEANNVIAGPHQAARMSAPRRASDARMSVRKLRLLVVDDSKRTRRVMMKCLEIEGFECDGAADGSEAVEKVRAMTTQSDGQGMYDAILMDFIMGIVHGPQATKDFRDMGFRGAIIGLTGNLSEIDRDMFFKNGGDYILLKPLDIDALRQVLEGK
jgi:CheY-like chemotaxis protein